MAGSVSMIECQVGSYSSPLLLSERERDSRTPPTSKRKLLLFTSPFFGVQLAWTIQQIFGASHLARLGFSDYQMPLIMLSGPLAGFIVPPVLGTLSDNCQSTWGKRKPFVFWGGIFVLVSNILMAAAQDVASLLEGWLDDTDTATKIIAGVSIYILNFAMQPLALGLRTHAVDHFGPLEQSLVSLWVSRCSSLGSVFVALMAYTTSPPIIGLTITSSAVLALLLLVSLFMTPNIAYHQVNRNSHNHDGLRPFHRQLSRTLKCIRNLPPVIRKVCIIQLLAWFAWFPILNYASVYISQIYLYQAESKTYIGSERAIARLALLFHTGAFLTSLLIPVLYDHAGLKSLSDAVLVLMGSWRLCLGTLTIWMSALSFGGGSSVTAASFLLGSVGVLFAVSNWIPHALIMHEISSLRQRPEDGGQGIQSTSGGQDDTATLVAIHNMAICIPQIIAAGAVAVLFVVLSSPDNKEDQVSWAFLLTVPAALVGVWASRSSNLLD